jgi:phage shock protein A
MKTLNRLRATITANFDNFVSQVENQEAIVHQLTQEVKEALAEVKIKIKETRRMIEHKEKRVQQINQEIKKWQSFYKELEKENPEQSTKAIKRILFLKDEQENHQNAIVQLDQTLNSLSKEQYLIEDKLREVHVRKASLVAKESKIKSQELSNSKGRTNSDLEDIFNRWENKLIKVETTQESFAEDGEIDFSNNKDELEKMMDEKEMQKRIQAEIESLKS